MQYKNFYYKDNGRLHEFDDLPSNSIEEAVEVAAEALKSFEDGVYAIVFEDEKRAIAMVTK